MGNLHPLHTALTHASPVSPQSAQLSWQGGHELKSLKWGVQRSLDAPAP